MERFFPGGFLVLLLLLFTLPLKLIGQSSDTPALIETADSLTEAQDYDAAIRTWNEIHNLDSTSEKEKNLCQSKVHYIQGLKLSAESEYGDAAKSFKAAVESGHKLETEIHALYLKDVYTSYYHALAYSSDWQGALDVGLNGFEHIGSYLEGKSRADFLYDLGYLNDQVGNYAEAIQLYESSIDELKALDETIHFDIGLAYNNLSTNYKLMGFFTARFNSLREAQKYWERDADNIDYSYFITLYGNLLKVYLEYGDVAMAEEMLHKTDSILNAQERVSPGQTINQHRLHVVLHNAKNEPENAAERLDAFYRYYRSLKNSDREKYQNHLLASIQSLVDKQASVNQTQTSAHYLDLGLEIAHRFDNLYYQMALNSEYSKIADQKNQPFPIIIAYLNAALAVNEKTNIGQENLMTLNLRKAQYYSLNEQPDSAKKYIGVALNSLESFDGNSLYDLNIQHFDQQNSVYIINALINAAGLYLSFYSINEDKNEAQLSLHLYELAARVFESYYQKGSYNASLN
ncbi:MAG: hypothetical protein LC664_04780, partial [Flavobacteriales bacterium]|nr:hypothetical protein [Flavobacteriales bacterium]